MLPSQNSKLREIIERFKKYPRLQGIRVKTPQREYVITRDMLAELVQRERVQNTLPPEELKHTRVRGITPKTARRCGCPSCHGSDAWEAFEPREWKLWCGTCSYRTLPDGRESDTMRAHRERLNPAPIKPPSAAVLAKVSSRLEQLALEYGVLV